jgi:hypothetical protein
MNVFNQSMVSGDFFYQVGSVYTKKMWYKPTYEKIELFLNEIKNLTSYDMYLVGGVVNGKIGNTWDVDIVVTGPIVYQEFEDVLHNIYDLALNKYRMLVDVRWYDKPIERLKYLIDNNQTEKWKTIRYGYYFKKIGEDVSEINLFEKCKRLTDYLIESEVTFPLNKSLNIQNNYIKV